jgi:hypothetical protein
VTKVTTELKWLKPAPRRSGFNLGQIRIKAKGKKELISLDIQVWAGVVEFCPYIKKVGACDTLTPGTYNPGPDRNTGKFSIHYLSISRCSLHQI